jgi:hypothetical protein
MTTMTPVRTKPIWKLPLIMLTTLSTFTSSGDVASVARGTNSSAEEIKVASTSSHAASIANRLYERAFVQYGCTKFTSDSAAMASAVSAIGTYTTCQIGA